MPANVVGWPFRTYAVDGVIVNVVAAFTFPCTTCRMMVSGFVYVSSTVPLNLPQPFAEPPFATADAGCADATAGTAAAASTRTSAAAATNRFFMLNLLRGRRPPAASQSARRTQHGTPAPAGHP